MTSNRTPSNPTIPEELELPEIPERGASIGRFLVLGSLGMGGMAVVLSAYDPQLDRKVALKMLRGDVWRGTISEASRQSLVREAQAMARLNHPNVVAVHEVAFGEEGCFLVMEQVEGTTLRGWLDAGERRWDEVVDLFLAAGAGLAAAHDAGLVHHDFKPENVLVGADGRARVSDFGLAGAGTPGAGTRAYMAPEQTVDDVVDARADVYAFCVTLWEALHGERPGEDPAPPPGRKAPRWITRVLARGLARRPADRWPSMHALLHALRRRRSLGTWAALAAAALLAVAVAAFAAGRQGSAAPVCAGAGARLAGVWDEARRSAVQQAFAAAGLSYGDDAWRGASARLDRYARDWTAMHTDACRATHVDGRQSAALLDLRMGCLERARSLLGSLTELWARGVDGETVARAVTAAEALPPLSECADTRALAERTRVPADPALAARVAAARRSIDGARVMYLSGRLLEARKLAAAARVEAQATGWAHARAEAALLEGKVEGTYDQAGAEAPLIEAARLAEEAHDDRIAAAALIDLVISHGMVQQGGMAALALAELAEGVVARLGNDPLFRARLLSVRGQALRMAGRLDEARAALAQANELLHAADPGSADGPTTLGVLASIVHDQGRYQEARRLGEASLAATVAALGPRHPRVAVVLTALGRTAGRAGDYDRAADAYRRALEIREEAFGHDSTRSADTLNLYGSVELQLGHLDRANALLERALAILERQFGPDDPYVASILTNLATARRKQGRGQEALDLLQRALAIKLRVFGPDHRSTSYAQQGIGETLFLRGDLAGALAYQRRALDARTRTLGPDHEETLSSAALVGGVLGELGRCPEARPLLATATAGLEKALGPGHVDVAIPLVATAGCDLAERRPAWAVARSMRALAQLQAGRAPPVDRGGARWVLARALFALGRRDAALAAARVAERELAADADGARDREAARAWLARHGR